MYILVNGQEINVPYEDAKKFWELEKQALLKKSFIKELLSEGFAVEKIDISREYGIECLRKRFADKSSIIITSQCGAALPSSEKDFRITYYKSENFLDETLSEEDKGTDISGSVFSIESTAYFTSLDKS